MNCITFGIVLSISVICDGSCLSGTRRVILKDGSEDCVFCKECPTDHVVARVCSAQGDTLCCPLNTYLPPTEMKQMCLNCSVCPAGQYVSRQCSLTEDVECTDCPNGTFTDDNNSLTCNNCTEDCEHGVQAYCSRSSDTKCKGAKANIVVIIVVIGVVLVLMVPCVTVSVVIYCRRRRTSKHKENVKETKHGETDTPLIRVDRNKEIEEEPSDSITHNITTTDVGDDTVVIDLAGEPECKTVETNQQQKLEFKESHLAIQQENVNADINIVRKETPKDSITTSKENVVVGEEITASTVHKTPSIGILYDTIVGRQWAVFVVGENSVMTSVEAYECMKVVRKGHLGSVIQGAHVTFQSIPFSFKISLSEKIVDDQFGVVIMNLSGDFKSPSPLKIDTSPLNQDNEYQIYTPVADLKIQRIDTKLDRMNEAKIASMEKFLQRDMPEFLTMRDNYRKVNTIKDKSVTLKADTRDTNISKYRHSYCFSGTAGRVLLGSPVCVKTPGQESYVVGVCTRTIPWVFQHLDNHEYDFLKEHAYIICTPISDILPIISKKNKQLSKEIFKS